MLVFWLCAACKTGNMSTAADPRCLRQWPGHAFPPPQCLSPLQLAASTAKHAAAALTESRQRAAREQRMARLKVWQGCWAGGNTSMHSRSSAHACSKRTPASKLALPCRLFPPGD